MKKCPKCQKTLPIESFSKNKCKKDGLQSQCKICRKQIEAVYFQIPRNKVRQRHRNKLFNKTNKDKSNEYKAKLGCKFCTENNAACLDYHHYNDDKNLLFLEN